MHNYLILPDRHEYIAQYETTFVISTPITIPMDRNLIVYLDLYFASRSNN